MADENTGTSSSTGPEISFLRENLNNFYINEEYCFGYLVGDDKQLEDFLDTLQLTTSTCFIKAESHSKEKGHKRLSLGALPIFENKRGNVPIEMFGNPFTVISNDVRHCLHGSRKDSRGGWKPKTQEHDYSRKRKQRSSVKMNCTATLQIRGIKVYKDYFVDHTNCTSDNNLKKNKTRTLKEIQNTLEENADHCFSLERRFYMKIPLRSAHSGHQFKQCQTMGRKIDERVVNKIHDLVKCNVKNVAEVKRCLVQYVEEDLFGGFPETEKPKKGHKRYYPRKSDIRAHITNALTSPREDGNEQEVAINIVNSTVPDLDDELLENDFSLIDDDDEPLNSSSENEEIKFLKENLNNFIISEDYCFGYLVGDDKQLEDFLDTLQLITSTCFIRAESHSKEKGHKRMSFSAPPIFEDKRGNVPIEMFGNPFTPISRDVRHCLHGSIKDSRGSWKPKTQEHGYSRKRKQRSSVKMNCTATLQIRGIKVYKDYFVDHANCTSDNNLKKNKTRTLKEIQNTLEENADHCFSLERRFYMKIPLSSAHSRHQFEQCQTVGRKIDERVVNKIYDLVKCNVKNVAEVKRCLVQYVEEDLFGGVPETEKPKKGHKRYYPRKSDIRAYITDAIKGS